MVIRCTLNNISRLLYVTYIVFKSFNNIMDFDSPDVMKNFPGLYASDLHKKGGNESDYSDENDKTAKKDTLLIKRKEKKDKKDKEKGYAALEGESSGDENGASKSPSKSKKSKSFKFTSSKSKEKREKSREKDVVEPKKEKDKKSEKKMEKEKVKSEKSKKVKHSMDEQGDIAEALPIFGVYIENAIEFGRCHDDIDIPLPIRECIDYIEACGINFEGIYKVSGTKSKALHIKKLYNQRQNVNFGEYDIPTVCSVLKMFLRDLPESIFTNDLLVRFEEAGAILTTNTREKHLKILMENLPPLNRTVLGWIIVHLINVSENEKGNKMSKNALAGALHHSLHCSPRLLVMLLNHSEALFPEIKIITYIPPLSSAAVLPEDPEKIEVELRKQESLLNLIHKEMNAGCISKQREELLWEVQRIITQLKRTLKNVAKEAIAEKKNEEKVENTEQEIEIDIVDSDSVEIEDDLQMEPVIPDSAEAAESISEELDVSQNTVDIMDDEDDRTIDDKTPTPCYGLKEKHLSENIIKLMLKKNKKLTALRDYLMNDIKKEYSEIEILKSQLDPPKQSALTIGTSENGELDKVMELLRQENQMLLIKKINLVRQIIEQREICIDLKSKIEVLESLNSSQ